MAERVSSYGACGSCETYKRMFSNRITSSQLSGWPLIADVPAPCAITSRIKTRRITPAGGSLSRLVPSTSLRRLILKWSGSPSPHQNQSNRRVSITMFEMATSSTIPPSNTMKARPRLELVMTRLSIATRRIAFELPSQNFNALDAEDNRQLVTVTFSTGNAGPQIAAE